MKDVRTSNFARVRMIPEGVTRVSIARFPPRWAPRHDPAWIYRYDLAPTRDVLLNSGSRFYQRFRAELKKLDPLAVLDSLPERCVLLCFEPPLVRCHRRIVAEWLEVACGIIVPEVLVARDVTPRFLDMQWE